MSGGSTAGISLNLSTDQESDRIAVCMFGIKLKYLMLGLQMLDLQIFIPLWRNSQ